MKVTLTKRALASITPATIVDLGTAGRALAQAIRDRMTVAGMDADNKPLPPPAATKRGWRCPVTDQRWPDDAGKKVAIVKGKNGTRFVEQPDGSRLRVVRYFEGGYAQAKRAAGAKPITDGKLTGAMWAGLGVLISTRGRAGKTIVLRFAGSSKSGKVRVENRVKAAGWERRDPNTLVRTSDRKMAILAFSDEELAMTLKTIARGYNLQVKSISTTAN